MRLQKISTSYPVYLERFYSQRQDLAAQSYSVQYAALMEDSFGWADFWTVALAKRGLEVSEIVANSEPMQRQWAKENGINFDDAEWLLDITRAQIRAFSPDVLFVDDYLTFTRPFLRAVKNDCPSIRLVIGWCGAPYNDSAVFREYDVVLSCIPELVQDFREQGLHAYHLNHAFDERILLRIKDSTAPTVDFAFLGSIVKRNAFHTEREKLLLALVEKTDLQIWSDIRQTSTRTRCEILVRGFAYDVVRVVQGSGIPGTFLTSTPLVNRVARWQTRPNLPEAVDKRIASRAQPPLFGLAMFRQLHATKIALNTHIDISSQSASNMRLYEATGVGSCLLTDWKPNLSEMFEPEVEVVTFRDPAECLEKVQYLLAHENKRREIAEAGQRRTLREHTFSNRSKQLCEIIDRHLDS